jgi:hypothetical protein
MSRNRKVSDLYETVEPIRDAGAFQLVIDGEPDDFVLGDLRDRFWNGQGEKPWQVIEINRLLTKRKQMRATSGAPPLAGSEVAAPSKPSSLKDRIENNLPIFFLATALSAFLTGVGAYQGVLKVIDYTPTSNDSLRALREEVERKKQDVVVLENKLKSPDGQNNEQRWLRIRGIDGLAGSRARVVARVNGKAYSYPSRAVWAMLGPGMTPEDFPLPIGAQIYDISFELLTLSADNQYRQFQSQEVVSVRSWPHEGEYKILAVTADQAGSVRAGDSTRSGTARVSFEVR